MRRWFSICVGCLLTLSAFAEGAQEGYYENLKNQAWKSYDAGDSVTANNKFQEIFNWSRAMTNEVLRYKSAGGMALIATEQAEKLGAGSTQEQREKVLLLCRNARQWCDVVAEIRVVDQLPDEIKQKMVLEAGHLRKRLDELQRQIDNQKVRVASMNESQPAVQTVKIREAKTNPYEMDFPLGALRGLATTVMAPCDLFLAWPLALESGDLWIGVVPVAGTIVASTMVVVDVGLGLADFCTLGYVGNEVYDKKFSPWWWERFPGGKASGFR